MILKRFKSSPRNSLKFHTSKINRKQFEKIKSKYLDFDPSPGSSKYLDYERWIPKFISYSEKLEIIHHEPLAILDLGTGPGFFPFVCKNFHHEVRTIDLPDNPMYKDLIDFFELHRREQSISAFELVKPFDLKFDLVTAFAICFNNHATENLWGTKEWEFFINDLKQTHLKDNARIYLEFNQEPDGSFLSPELSGYFESLGALIDGSKVDIQINNESES